MFPGPGEDGLGAGTCVPVWLAPPLLTVSGSSMCPLSLLLACCMAGNYPCLGSGQSAWRSLVHPSICCDRRPPSPGVPPRLGLSCLAVTESRRSQKSGIPLPSMGEDPCAGQLALGLHLPALPPQGGGIGAGGLQVSPKIVHEVPTPHNLSAAPCRQSPSEPGNAPPAPTPHSLSLESGSVPKV